MNERISKLRLQACKWASENVPIGEYENASDEKFAELIVKECVKVCEDNATYLTLMSLKSDGDDGIFLARAEESGECAGLIKEHFGVEQ
jgi:hypothetical protein